MTMLFSRWYTRLASNQHKHLRLLNVLTKLQPNKLPGRGMRTCRADLQDSVLLSDIATGKEPLHTGCTWTAMYTACDEQPRGVRF